MALPGIPACWRHAFISNRVQSHKAAADNRWDERDGSNPAPSTRRESSDSGGTYNGNDSFSEDVGVIAATFVYVRLDGEVDCSGLAMEGLAGEDEVVVEDAHLAQLDRQREAGRVPA